MRYKDESVAKANGVVYTPTQLAQYLSARMLVYWDSSSIPNLRILDPAIGDGELVLALLNELSKNEAIYAVDIVAFEIDKAAIEKTEARICSAFPYVSVEIINEDFISYAANNSAALGKFDLIIANPPYIRTQIIGPEKARKLANDFGVTGRIDMYYAFLLLATKFVSDGGVVGFITSNKFMSIKSGESIRSYLKEHVQVLQITDFGDTKLFNAAVLPCTIIYTLGTTQDKEVKYTSIYETHDVDPELRRCSVFDAIDIDGVVLLDDGKRFSVRQGVLANCRDGAPWVLTSPSISSWKNKVSQETWRLFSNIGKIKVGVKTTADKVFIKPDWSKEGDKPELLYPLITHRNAGQIVPNDTSKWGIVYPHTSKNGKHVAVDISMYPNTEKYLEKHRDQLEARKYVIEAGRNWYEIWVPQNPAAWEDRKIVFRDITETPQFWLDNSGAIVNGDCYWIDIYDTTTDDEVYLALAIANSHFIEKYYDLFFNTKLYAGKRRFMSQYVSQFPIPYPESPLSIHAIELVKAIIQLQDQGKETSAIKAELDDVVEEIFC
ncbi:MAG: N-6 DNA methylase [Coriobacteriales bacterium]|jgi:tRNA1(Val) A37 N6-methylase TrmN6|nr:N-6 DNA methylase [Coriobacteriales bacterium]